MLAFIDIRFVAILVSTVAYMLIGWLWYSPLLFGRVWKEAVGLRDEELPNPGPALAGSAAAGFIMSYMLGYFVMATHSVTWFTGMILGVIIWLGFVFTSQILGVLFASRPWKLFLIDVGYLGVALAAMGAIIGGLSPCSATFCP